MRSLLIALSVAAITTASPLSQQQADVFEKKLLLIVQQGEKPAENPRHTTLSEGEVNSYLTFKAGPLLPVGVAEPSIGIRGEGRLHGRAVVDLDVVRKQRGSGSWLDPTTYLTGRLPLTATGVLHTRDGKGRFELERAEVSGIPIPKSFLQELVSYYTRSADHPRGIGLDDVFELPANIQRIEVGKEQAVIVQ